MQWFQSLVAFPQKEFLCRASLAVKPSLLTLNCGKMLLRCRSWIHRSYIMLSLSLMRLFHFTEKALALDAERITSFDIYPQKWVLWTSPILINLISNCSLTGKKSTSKITPREAFLAEKSHPGLICIFIFLYYVLFTDGLFNKKVYNLMVENQIISSHFLPFKPYFF